MQFSNFSLAKFRHSCSRNGSIIMHQEKILKTDFWLPLSQDISGRLRDFIPHIICIYFLVNIDELGLKIKPLGLF